MKPQFLDSTLAYPSVVHQLLTTRYANQTFTMVNEGVGQEKATTGYLRFPGRLDTHQPEVVLLLQGILDVISTPDDKDPPSSPIEALQTDIQAAKARGIRVLLSTLPPVGNGFQVCNVQNSTIRAANDNIRALATSENVHLVDIYPLFVGRLDEFQGVDGLHPSEAGQRAMGELFFDVIKKNFEVAGTAGGPASALARPQVKIGPPADRQPVRVPKRQQ
jgi:lysophospholipase L1-like esterase